MDILKSFALENDVSRVNNNNNGTQFCRLKWHNL